MDKKEQAKIRAKKWYLANKERAKKTRKLYKQSHPEIDKKYRETHKTEIALYKKEWAIKNKKHISAQHQRYYSAAKNKILARSKIQGLSLEYKFWKRWYNMHQRCYNPKYKSFYLWGGRGIKVCTRWHDFKHFKHDMWESFETHFDLNGSRNTTLDRINNNKNYSVKNCRWATMKIQQNNRRPKNTCSV